MKRIVLAVAAVVGTLALAGTAAAALSPWTYVAPNTSCPVVSTVTNGVLHLEKNCATTTNASAGATITGVEGSTLQSASFTLASTSQCQGGSPRFDVTTTNGTSSTLYFLGCNNVTPVVNADGTATYTFTPQTLAAAGNQVAFPSGAISSLTVLIDVQGTADLSAITVNGTTQTPTPTGGGGHGGKSACKEGGWWKLWGDRFRNQGQCVSWFNHQDGRGADDDHARAVGRHHHDHHGKRD